MPARSHPPGLAPRLLVWPLAAFVSTSLCAKAHGAPARPLTASTSPQEVTFSARVTTTEKRKGKPVEYVTLGRLVVTPEVEKLLAEEETFDIDCVFALRKKTWEVNFDVRPDLPGVGFPSVALRVQWGFTDARSLGVRAGTLAAMKDAFVTTAPAGAGFVRSEIALAGDGSVPRSPGMPSDVPDIAVAARDGEDQWPPYDDTPAATTTELANRYVVFAPTTCWVFVAN